MEDFLKFKKMLTPLIIQIVFWIGVAICVIMGLISMAGGLNTNYGGGAMVFYGLLLIVLGPVVIRIYCEILIVIFSINDTLTEIKNSLKDKTSV